MRRIAFLSSLLSLSIAFLFGFAVLAQSGRGRQPATPPPKPTSRPPTPGSTGRPPAGATTVLNLPEGGKMLRQDIDGPTTRYVLRNGLTVLIRERHSIPLAAATVLVKAGAIQESDDQAGVAHLTSSWMRAGKDITGTMARLGARFSSEVDYDNAALHMVAPAESLERGLQLFAEMVINPAFPAAELTRAQRETVRAAKRFQDEIEKAALDRLYATAFTSHRIRRGRYPGETRIAPLTREQVVAFHQAHYQPQNAVIAISGDVFPSQMIGKIQLAFGKWVKGTTASAAGAVIGSEEPAQDRIRYANARADIPQTLVTIGYRAPAGPNEQPALEMLAAVLAAGRGSRLAQVLTDGSRLTEPERNKGDLAGLITHVDSSHKWFLGGSMLTIALRVDPARIDRAEAEYFREIERFKREVISDGELQRARYFLEKKYHDSTARVEDEAEQMARYQGILGDYKLQEARNERTTRVRAKEIQQLAARILNAENLTVVEFEPQTAQARTFTPETFADTMVVFAPTLLQPVKPDEIKPAPALRTFRQGAERSGTIEGRNVIISEAPVPVKDFSVLRGPRAFVREDRSRPVVAVGILFQGGRLLEDQTTSGMTELMLRVMLKSTQTKKSDLIALESESYGSEIKIVNEPDYFGFVVDGLSRNSEPATRLVLDIIENPYFDKAELLRERAILMADIGWAGSNAPDRARQLLWSSLYPGHPYGYSRYGLTSVVGTATEAKLEAWHGLTMKRQFPLLVVVGDTDGSAIVSRIFSEAFKRDELDKSLKVALPNLTEPPKSLAELREKHQTSQALGVRSPAGQTQEALALMLLAEAGRARLNSELVEKQGVADKVEMINDAWVVSGVFGATVTSAPDQESKALELTRNELTRLGSSPPSGDEFDAARNAAIGGYAISVEDHFNRLREYARNVFCGRKASDVDTQPDLMRAIRQAELKRISDASVKLTMAGYGAVRGK
jgi:zinc protease